MDASTIIKKISHFLFSRANREFLIFLFFFALAGIFWLFMTLNETYEQEVRIPVSYTGVPKNVVLTSGETDTLRVNVSDKGIILATYLFGNQLSPVSVDFNTYTHSKGMGQVGLSDLKRLISTKLTASTKIVSIKPERLTFYYNTGERKRVPVRVAGDVIAEKLYYLAGTEIQPDSVTIFASREKLDSINEIYTEPLNYTNVRDTLTVHAQLQKMASVKTVPSNVVIKFRADILSEMNIDGVSITGINMPEGKVLRTFPAKVSVKFVAGVNQYRNLSAADFEVVADYEEIMAHPSSKCRIYLQHLPEGISQAHLDTTFVEYLIEE